MSDLASAVFSVVMVGHSLFGSTGPDMLHAALSARVEAVEVQAQIINGAPLKYNWEQSRSAEGIDAREVLPTGQATDLILTEAIPLANHLQWSETGVYAQAFAELARAANPEARVWVQEGWHSLNSGTGVAVPHDDNAETPWRVRLQDDLGAWEDIVADLRGSGETQSAQLIPAGQALGALSDAIDADDVPKLDRIADVFDDDIHLNALGHYFVSMVQFAALTGSEPTGLPHVIEDRYGATVNAADPAQAAVLQRIAAKAVADYRGQALAPGPAAAATSPRAPPSSTAAPAPAAPSDRGSGQMAVGLAAVTDWSTQQPFLDVMKTARPWIGHMVGQFGGIEYAALVEEGHIDADGWVTSLPHDAGSVGTLILTDMPREAQSLAGRYVLSYEGRGVVEPLGRVSNVRYAPGEVRFDYTPGPGSVEIRIQRTSAGDPVRRISVVREEDREAWQRGAIFNPDFLDRLKGFDTLRFMDWMETNNSTQSGWSDRPRPGDATWAHYGVPLEVMLALVDELEVDAWFNMPHLADDAYVRSFAQKVAATLPDGQRAYVEYSNEVWNFQFAQTRWADAQAQALWGQDDVGTQFYARRAAQVARIWSKVFEDAPERLVNVISTQTGWLGLEENILDAPLVRADGAPAPKDAFDAYAVTGYFGGVLGLEERRDEVIGWLDESRARAAEAAAAQGLTGQARRDAIDGARYDHANAVAGQELNDGSVSANTRDTVTDLSDRVFPYHAAVAQAAGLDLIMYEGGSHVVGIGPQVDDERLTAFFHSFNYSAEMGVLYKRLIAGWRAAGGGMFNAYADIYNPTKWGSWGALRHLDDSNPRWDALVAAR